MQGTCVDLLSRRHGTRVPALSCEAAGKGLKELVGERGFEPPTPWSRTRYHYLLKPVEICWL